MPLLSTAPQAWTARQPHVSACVTAIGVDAFRSLVCSRCDWVILASFLLGTLVLAFAFGSVPPGLNVDEASPGYDAYALLQYGIDRNGFHNPLAFVAFGSGTSAMEPYLVMPFVALFGLNTFALRLPFLLAGVAAIFLFARLVTEVHGARTARVATFLLAICPWHIMIPRLAHESSLLPFVMLAGALAAVTR